MTQEHATSFVADGDTERGFETGAGNIKIGVFARGSEKGVWGIGPYHGVRGETDSGIGVEGEAFRKGIGIHGIAHGEGDGVKGENKSNGSGVVGIGRWGVYGHGELAHGEIDNGVNTPRGVFGFSGNGFGVFGSSTTGPGLRGESEHSYGGVFSSPFAQIWLQPAETTGPPNGSIHKRGELFCDSKGDLFFCVKGGTPGVWRRVRLEGYSWFADLVDRLGIGNFLRR